MCPTVLIYSILGQPAFLPLRRRGFTPPRAQSLVGQVT